MSKIKTYICKVQRRALRNSWNDIAKKMAGAYHSEENPWKYLTASQLTLVNALKIPITFITEKDFDSLKRLLKDIRLRVNMDGVIHDISIDEYSKGVILSAYGK